MGISFNLSSNRADGKAPGIISRIVGTLFFFVFFAMGMGFIVFMGLQAAKGLKRHRWEPVSCTVVSSSVEDVESGENPYLLKIIYKYKYKGREYTSERYRYQETRYSSFDKANSIALKYPKGGITECMVNPVNPGEAILKHDSLAILPFMLIPLVFVVVGLGGMIAMWRPGKSGSGDKRGRGKPVESISQKASGGGGTLGAVLFFGVFLLAGLGFFYGFFVRPALKIMDARDWQAYPCVIKKSRVQSHSSDDGTTYSVDIVFSYEVEGRKYTGGRYQFMGGSSSGHAGKAKVVADYPVGSTRECFVNPNNPGEAVIKRSFTPDMFFGLIPLVFVLVGGGGIFFVLRANSRKKRKQSAEAWNRADDDSAGKPAVWESRYGAFGKFIGMLIFNLIWNGIVAVMIFQLVAGYKRGRPDHGLWLFVIIFGAVGLGVLAGLFHSFLNLFNPRVRLLVSVDKVPLGGRMDLKWQVLGNASRISRLKVYAEAREEATYRRGTNTYTDKNVFLHMDLADVTTASDIPAGVSCLEVPADTMHSLNASNNKIVWEMTVHGDIARWPDVKETFKFEVLPLQEGIEA